MRRADVLFWWVVMCVGIIAVAALIIYVGYPRIQVGEPDCDELLDRLVEARADYHQSDSARDFSAWWEAAHAYCEECQDWKLCDGTRPK